MDDIGQKSGHLMLITPERVSTRACSAARANAVRVRSTSMSRSRAGCGSRPPRRRKLRRNGRRVAEYQAHHRQRYRSVLSVVIEPESVCSGVLEDLVPRLTGPEGEAFTGRIRAAYRESARASRRRRVLQRRIRSPVPWRGPAAARTRSPRRARDFADRKILRLNR